MAYIISEHIKNDLQFSTSQCLNQESIIFSKEEETTARAGTLASFENLFTIFVRLKRVY